MPNAAIVASRVSDSARTLSEALNREARNGINCLYRRADRSYGRQRVVDTLINWGSSNVNVDGETRITAIRWLNSPSTVNLAANKLNAFRRWDDSEVPNLEFTTNRQVAHGWLTSGATEKVYCRTTLRGNSGDGIVVARSVPDVVQAPLYTKGIDIRHEFRFHVMGGIVFDGVRKSFRSDVPEEDRNYDVRNHAAGTVFVRSGPSLAEASRNQRLLSDCALAVSTLGLDFGAVDVLVDRQGQHHIIEVNTACGLEGTTLERYRRAFTEKLSNQVITPWSLGEFTGSEETQPTQEPQDIRMNISNATVSAVVTFNPTVTNNIRTLTVGNSYTITRVGNEVIYVRNNAGRIQGYRPAHFTLGAGAAPAAPAPVVFEGPEDGSIDTSVPPTSSQRIVRLGDNTSVNVSGQAVFDGESRRVSAGDTVTIVDMYRGVDTGDVFLGVEVDGETWRFLSTSFSNGEPCVDGVEGLVAPTGPSALDIAGGRLRDGDYIQVRSEAGGHNLAVGTLGQVVAISETRISIQAEGNATPIRIQPSRVGKITRSDHTRLLAEAEAIRTQETTQFTVGTNSYRVASRDMQELHQVLRRFTV